MNSITIKIKKEEIQNLLDYYQDYQVDNKGEYKLYSFSCNNVLITVWDNKKDYYKITFVGKNALKEAKIWDKEAKFNEKKQIIKEEYLDTLEQIGSDEVGVGDLFMPMIVVAAYISDEDYEKLKDLGIHDSKKLSDNQIKKIGPTIIKEFSYSKLTLTNEKYNAMLLKGENLNSLKARMHNQALKNMLKKHPNVQHIYLDQFVNEKKYYEYIIDKDIPLKNVTFKEKGESYYPSIALASVIARYALLLYKEELENKYGLSFPLGAGKEADNFLEKMLKKYPLDEVEKLLKNNFKNFQTIKKEKN